MYCCKLCTFALLRLEVKEFLGYKTYKINSSQSSTAAHARRATTTKDRFLNAAKSATAVPIIAETICPEEYSIKGKVIADKTV